MSVDKEKQFSFMKAYTRLLAPSVRDIVGQEEKVKEILGTFLRPELANVLLLGEAGVGKTSVVKATLLADPKRMYLEVDLALMVNDCGDNLERLSGLLKGLFNEVEMTVAKTKQEIVLFIDEFHQLVTLSSSAVEAIKPLLAESGTKDIRVIVATTYREYQDLVKVNEPLVERLQEVKLVEPSKETVVKILQNMLERYEIVNYDKVLPALIYDYTNRYAPANAQPRKSILILDAMIGRARLEKRRFDLKLLADVFKHSLGVNIAFQVDGSSIKKRLDEAVFDQNFATRAIEERLQLCVADLNNPDRPLATFLFAGTSGVGKTEVSKTLAEILFEDKRALIRFDMTEFSNPDSFNRFKKELTRRVSERPNAIVMLDEIEKSCREITLLLLQVLDDARLLDEYSREVSFKNVYIIMTTNAGKEIFADIAKFQKGYQTEAETELFISRYDKLIRRSLVSAQNNKFPEELLGRIDVIVPFKALTEKTLERITRRTLDRLADKVMARHHIKLTYDERVVRYIAGDKLGSNSDDLGARGVVSTVVNTVDVGVAKLINENPYLRNIHVYIDGDLRDDNKTELISRAKVAFEID